MRILALANPRVAGGGAPGRLDAFRRRHADSTHQFDHATPASAEGLRQRILNAAGDGYDAVMLVGGDGTLHAALPALVEAGISFGLLPFGRGNDFARAAGIPLDPRASVYRATHPRVVDVHAARVNGVPYATVSSLGFDASVGRLAQEGKGWFPGTLGYLMCVLRALPEWRPFTARVTVDGNRWCGRVMAIAVANGPCYGGGMNVAPAATPSDDLLHVFVLEELPKRELLPLVPALIRGTHTTHPRVRMISGRSIEVDADRAMDLLADGEWLGRTDHPFWAAGGDWLRLLLPDGAEPSS